MRTKYALVAVVAMTWLAMGQSQTVAAEDKTEETEEIARKLQQGREMGSERP